MIMFLGLKKGAAETLQRQIFAQIRDQILSGRLSPGTALPPSRLLAQDYQVSRNTVLQAYAWLAAEGYVETELSARTIVSRNLPELSLAVACGAADPPVCRAHIAAKARVVFPDVTPMVHSRPQVRQDIDFWPGRPNRRHFPLQFFRRAIDEHLGHASVPLSDYGDIAGSLCLRQALSHHLKSARGVSANPDQIIITAGTQEALNLISRLFIQRGTKVVVENPTYQGAALIFRSFGAELTPVDVDADGMVVDRLPSASTTLAYVTPSHQFPTGAALNLDRRLKLIEWARRTGAYVVEDDYDSDYRYSGPPMIALAGIDTSDSVIYLGTFSKSVGAGLRTGYVVLPPQLTQAGRAVKALMNGGHPWLEQIALADFLASGSFMRHLRRIRRAYASVRDRLVEGLQVQFGDIDLWGAASGMHVMWRLPPGFPDAEALATQTRRYGAEIHTLRSGGAIDFGSCYARDSILLGYSSLTEEEVETGVRAIARAVESLGRAKRAEPSHKLPGRDPARSGRLRARGAHQSI